MSTRRSWCQALLLSAACVSLLASADIARSQGANVPTLTVAQFVANPPELLKSRSLSGDVVTLLGADHSTLAAIVGLLPTATPVQQTAIINGLAQVAVGLQTIDPAFAQAIQQAIAQTGNQTWITAMAQQIGGVAIGAAAGAGGGTGGGGPTSAGGASGGVNTGGGITPLSSTPNLSTNLLTGGTVAGTGGSTTTNLTISVSSH